MSGYWPEFLMVAVAHLVAVASPGPDFALVVRQSLQHGRRTALGTSLGIGAGIFVHVSYSLLGVGMLMQSSALWFHLMKYAGAAYLAWIGWQSMRRRAAVSEDGSPLKTTHSHGAFMTGFSVNVLNPKAALFFIALFSVVVDPRTPVWIKAGYGVWMAAVTATWFSIVAHLFTRASVRRAFLKTGPWMDRLVGVVLLALAAKLILSS